MAPWKAVLSTALAVLAARTLGSELAPPPEPTKVFQDSRNVLAMSFSPPDGKYLASGGFDQGAVNLYDMTQLHRDNSLLKSPWPGAIRSVAYRPRDGSQLASGGADGAIRVWMGSKLLHTLWQHTDEVDTLAFDPDGKQMASGSWDKTIRLWDAQQWTLSVALPLASYLYSVAWKVDGQRVAAATYDGTIRIWKTAPGVAFEKKPEKMLTLSGAIPYSIAFTPDGSQLVAGCSDNTISIWDTATWTFEKKLEGHTNAVRSLAFNPVTSQLASASWDESVRIWDTDAGTCLQVLKHNNIVQAVAYSPDGKTFASGGGNMTIKIWQPAPGNLLQAPALQNTSSEIERGAASRVAIPRASAVTSAEVLV